MNVVSKHKLLIKPAAQLNSRFIEASDFPYKPLANILRHLRWDALKFLGRSENVVHGPKKSNESEKGMSTQTDDIFKGSIRQEPVIYLQEVGDILDSSRHIKVVDCFDSSDMISIKHPAHIEFAETVFMDHEGDRIEGLFYFQTTVQGETQTSTHAVFWGGSVDMHEGVRVAERDLSDSSKGKSEALQAVPIEGTVCKMNTSNISQTGSGFSHFFSCLMLAVYIKAFEIRA
ncbi:hypothetical protein BGW38_000545 [Lunasporangiospora selenospora]|uniref:Uncharacterized protein n=1 Tax=Lunasporangiospora selenospora TaxID=979761 RepID=A0A9P6FUQ0_9FUNG|nr:hypothetical protein BGW38_000545 [Lunasporangiospora selenospora]